MFWFEERAEGESRRAGRAVSVGSSGNRRAIAGSSCWGRDHGHQGRAEETFLMSSGLEDGPGGPVVELHLPMQGVWVPSLAGERSTCLHGQQPKHRLDSVVTSSIKTF